MPLVSKGRTLELIHTLVTIFIAATGTGNSLAGSPNYSSDLRHHRLSPYSSVLQHTNGHYDHQEWTLCSSTFEVSPWHLLVHRVE
jgi:hypothetical protein